MLERVVAMPAMPSLTQRGSEVRADLRYAKYARATWEWWCKKNGVHFVFLDQPLGTGVYEAMSPSYRRWHAIDLLLQEFGKAARIALVDADTMIHWDCPDLFDIAGPRFAAARAANAGWIRRDIEAYQSLFPGVHVPWWDYFNCGIVVLGEAQAPTVRTFLSFVEERWRELDAIQKAGQYSTDQTLLNFVVRLRQEPVNFLAPAFNLIHCFPMDDRLKSIERSRNPDWDDFAAHAFSRPEAFAFVNQGFIWHFTSVVRARNLVMKKTWEQVGAHYPGARVDEP